MSRFGRNLRQRGMGWQITPIQRIIRDGLSVLRSFGANAHAYIPGVGTINGLTAGNYLDSAGTTAASYDGLLGRLNDAAQTLGPELVVDTGFDTPSAWTTSGSVPPVVSGGVVSFNQPSAVYAYCRQTATFAALIIGKTYRVRVDCASYTAGQFQVAFVNATPTIPISGIAAAGSYTVDFVATQANTSIEISRIGALANYVATFDNISVREVIGIHATQATPANRPTLRSAGGLSYAQFDGVNDYLSLSAVPFQTTDDYLLLACVNPTKATNGILACHTGVGISEMITLATSAGVGQIYAVTGGVTKYVSGTTVLTGAGCVLAGRKSGTTLSLKVNGVAEGTPTSTVGQGASAYTVADIGRYPAWSYLQGNIYCAFLIKGTVSDADLLKLEKFAGLFGGVTI